MPPKEPRKGQSKQSAPAAFDLYSVQQAMEKKMRNIQKLAARQNFKSAKEFEAFLEKLNSTDQVPEWTPETPLEKAQDLIDSTYSMPDKRDRVKIARKALKLSPDCVDAYVILAEAAATPLEACTLYQAGVKAGERSLGEQAFKEDAGHFWDIVETRPYMRARLGLAQCLWAMGKKEEAVRHYQGMLRLNPDDNQGVRDLLAPALLQMGQLAELNKLLDEYKDEYSALWLYTRALVTYLQEKDSARAQKQLLKAFDMNPYIPIYLLGVKKLPEKLPSFYEPGHENEALWYLSSFLEGWLDHPNAMKWLADVLFGELQKYRESSQPISKSKLIVRVMFDELKKAQKSDKTTKIPAAFVRAFESEDKRQQS